MSRAEASWPLKRRAIGKWLAALAVLWTASPTVEISARAAPAPIIDYRARTLANGLSVYTVHEPGRHEVSVQVWYRVGSADDPPGRSGLAHLVEHLMFLGWANAPPDYLDDLADEAGGEANASTTYDFTEFHESITPRELERALWAEAERMDSLDVSARAMDAERHVVEQELRDSAAEEPDDSLASPGGGIIDVRRITLDEARAFHARYYRPDNAALVVVGDFQPEQLDAWIDTHFGRLPDRRATTPTGVASPRRHATSALKARHEPKQPPSTILVCPGPMAGSAGAAAIAVLSEMIDAEQSAPSQRRSRGLLSPTIVADAELKQIGGRIYIGAVAAAGKTSAQLDAAMRATTAQLRRRRASSTRVEAAKNRLLVDAYEDRETIEGIGELIGRAATASSDISLVNRQIPMLQRMNPRALRQAARLYLQDHDCIRAGARLALTARSRQARSTASAEKLAYLAPRHAPAPSRLAPPPAPPTPEPSPSFVLPPITEMRLPNGLRVIAARSAAVPLATAVLAVHGGDAADPPDVPELSKLAGRLALFGRVAPVPTPRAATYARLGLTADIEVHSDTTTLSLTGLAASMPDGLALLAQGMQLPALPPGDLAHARRDVIDSLRAEASDLQALADKALETAVIGAPNGSRSALARLRRKAVLERHAELFRPGNAVLVISGDIEPQTAFAWAARSFGDWTRAPGPTRRFARMERSPMAQAVLVDAPGAPRAEVAVGAQTVGQADPARAAIDIANSALGGGYTARLNRGIRVSRGLSYDAASTIERRQGADLFSAHVQTDPASAAEVARLMVQELQTLAAQGPGTGELAKTKARVIGDLDWRTRTSEELANLVAEQAISGAPISGLAEYASRISATSAPEVQAAAARLAAPGALSVVIVGDARRLARIRQQFPQLRVVRAVDLRPRLAPG